MIVLSAGVLATTVMGVAHAVVPTRPASVAMRSRPVATPSATPPELSNVPARVLIAEGQRSTVTMNGEGFEPGLSLTLVSDSFGFTYAPRIATSTSLEVDISAMYDGTYHVYVSDLAGRRSNQMTIVVGHATDPDAVRKDGHSTAKASKTPRNRDPIP